MSVQTQSQALTQTVQAPVKQVYEAFTTATRLCEWFSYDAQLEAAPGGRFYAYWREEAFYLMGEYAAVEPDALLAIQFQAKDNPKPAKVEIRFAERDGATEVTVEHEGEVSEALLSLWRKALVSLKSTQETGYTADTLQRPMLGVLLGANLTAENASRYGVPVDYGAALSGTLPGLSAEAAGLQRDDVLVSVGGQPVKAFTDIGPVLARHKAGDVLDVEFYRGAEKHAAPMELKARRFPRFPASPAELAEQIRPEKARLMEELHALLAGVSEAEAAHQAAPDKWSANQVIAHLIVTEREYQAQNAALVEGTEIEVFTGNMQCRVEAVAKRYGTTAALVQALETTHAETLDMLRALPESFLTRKASTTRVQLTYEADPFHVRHHFGQIRRAVEAARA